VGCQAKIRGGGVKAGTSGFLRASYSAEKKPKQAGEEIRTGGSRENREKAFLSYLCFLLLKFKSEIRTGENRENRGRFFLRFLCFLLLKFFMMPDFAARDI
jgi:hypothetical protein